MQLIGRVTRLQVQRSRMKEGVRGARRYDPAPLLEVHELFVARAGAVGRTPAGPVVDVHHEDHPDTRRRRGNGLCLLSVQQYAALRARYGNHLVDGVAGENLLLDLADGHTGDLPATLRVETDEGSVVLQDVAPAAPCVEFTRFVLRRGGPGVDGEVRRALAELDGGARGFYATVQGQGVVRPGAAVWAGSGARAG